MAIPVSTVPAALDALTSQIQTQVNSGEGASAPAVLVISGQEGADAPADIIVVSRSVDRRVNHEVLMGDYQTGSLKEEFTIEVVVSSWSGDPDPVVNEKRAWTLVGYVETAVRTDPTLGGNDVDARPAGSRGGQSVVTDSPVGHQTEITVAITVFTLN